MSYRSTRKWDGGGGRGRGLKRKGLLPRTNAEFPAVFISPKSERLQEGWLGEGAGEGRGDEPSLGVSIHGLNYFHNLAILVCQREDDTLFVMHSSRIMTQLAVQVSPLHSMCES